MKKLIIVVVVVALAVWGVTKLGVGSWFTSQKPGGVRIGATVDEVEKALGPATGVIPNYGREQRVYKAASGNAYMITFEDGKVVEIH